MDYFVLLISLSLLLVFMLSILILPSVQVKKLIYLKGAIFLMLLLPLVGSYKFGLGVLGSVVLRFFLYLSIIILLAVRGVNVSKGVVKLYVGVTWPLFIYILYNYITSFYLPEYLIWSWFKNSEIFLYYLLGIILSSTIFSYKDFQLIANAYMGFIALLIFLCVIEAIILPGQAFIPDGNIFGFRLKLVHPNNASALVTFVGCVMIFYNYIFKKFRFKNILMSIVSLVLVVLAGTRSIIAGFVVGGVWLLLSKARNKLTILVTLFGGLFLFVLFDADKYLKLLVDILWFRGSNVSSNTFSGRTIFWEKALQLFWENPILGNGYFSSTKFLFPSVFDMRGDVTTLEGMWINILVWSGLVGVATMILFFAKQTMFIYKCLMKSAANITVNSWVSLFMLIWIIIMISSVTRDAISAFSFDFATIVIINAALCRTEVLLRNNKSC